MKQNQQQIKPKTIANIPAAIRQEGDLSSEAETIQQLKRKIKKIEALAEFYDAIQKRKHVRRAEVKDSQVKIKFAKDQMIKLCDESQQIIRDMKKKTFGLKMTS